MKTVPTFGELSDADLTNEVTRLVTVERLDTALVVACLAEFDKRRLFLPAGFSSLFTYCRDFLHLGDGAAYRRIEAARASRRFPVVLERLIGGRLSLTNVSLLAPHLTQANHAALLKEATHKSTREVERMAAGLKPQPDVPTLIRKLPAPGAAPTPATEKDEISFRSPEQAVTHRPAPRPVIAPLTPERFKLQITMNQETHDRLRQLQNLMRHSIPSGDAALIVERALKLLLEEVLRRKCGALKPRREKEGLLQIERRALG